MAESTIGDRYVEDRTFPPSPEFSAAALVNDRSLWDEAWVPGAAGSRRPRSQYESRRPLQRLRLARRPQRALRKSWGRSG